MGRCSVPAALLLTLARSALAGDRALPDVVADTRVLEINGARVPEISGTAIAHLTAVACNDDDCQAIPFQVDEITDDGRWVLPSGPHPRADSPPSTFDRNDLLLWMARDAGDCTSNHARLPSFTSGYAVIVEDARDGTRRCVYLLATSEPAPRSARSYVAYDAEHDLLRGRRIALGFNDGVPDRLLAGTGGENLLDRFKVRARASLFWNLLHFTRDEGDLTTTLMGWHAGPIRIVRYQEQRIRLGWGIRSPTFAVYTFFHPDFAELPVALWLNFKPTHFFTDIQVDVLLDFRALDGWQLQLPDRPELRVGASPAGEPLASEGDWFALRGDDLLLAQTIDVSDSLAPARRRLLYRYGDRPQPPESVTGERPAIGYRFDHWENVDAGGLAIKAVAYALPPSTSVPELIAARSAIDIAAVELLAPSSTSADDVSPAAAAARTTP